MMIEKMKRTPDAIESIQTTTNVIIVTRPSGGPNSSWSILTAHPKRDVVGKETRKRNPNRIMPAKAAPLRLICWTESLKAIRGPNVKEIVSKIITNQAVRTPVSFPRSLTFLFVHPKKTKNDPMGIRLAYILVSRVKCSPPMAVMTTFIMAMRIAQARMRATMPYAGVFVISDRVRMEYSPWCAVMPQSGTGGFFKEHRTLAKKNDICQGFFFLYCWVR